MIAQIRKTTCRITVSLCYFSGRLEMCYDTINFASSAGCFYLHAMADKPRFEEKNWFLMPNVTMRLTAFCKVRETEF